MKINRRKFMWRGGLLVILAMLLDAFWIEKFFIRIRSIYWKGAKAGGKNLCIAQVSDVHLQSVGYALRRMAANIKACRPDLICFTGDIIDSADKWATLEEFLGLFDAQTPKVAILGNWEYWGRIDIEQLKAVYQTHNIQLLVNTSARFALQGKQVHISGVDDFLAGTPDYAAAEAQYSAADYHIVLNHCPQYTDTIRQIHQQPIDFILSGHTHGGQVNFFGFIPKLPPGSGKYVSGWYDSPAPPMYVSQGIGTSVVPVRFGARAEAIIFYLEASL